MVGDGRRCGEELRATVFRYDKRETIVYCLEEHRDGWCVHFGSDASEDCAQCFEDRGEVCSCVNCLEYVQCVLCRYDFRSHGWRRIYVVVGNLCGRIELC